MGIKKSNKYYYQININKFNRNQKSMNQTNLDSIRPIPQNNPPVYTA